MRPDRRLGMPTAFTGGPRVLFLHAGYFLPEFFDPSLPARRGSGGESDPLRKTGEAAGAESFHPSLSNPANRHLANFIQSTIDWLDSQEKTLVDACELRAYWKEHRSDFPNRRSECHRSAGTVKAEWVRKRRAVATARSHGVLQLRHRNQHGESVQLTF